MCGIYLQHAARNENLNRSKKCGKLKTEFLQLGIRIREEKERLCTHSTSLELKITSLKNYLMPVDKIQF